MVRSTTADSRSSRRPALPRLGLWIGAVLLATACRPHAEPVAPLLSLSVNDGVEVDLWQGWPLLVEALIYHPGLYGEEEEVTPIRLDAGREGWRQSLRLQVLDHDGQPADWPLELGEVPERSLLLDAETTATVAWSLAPEAAGSLAAGSYELRAILDAQGAGRGRVLGGRAFRGWAQSDPATVRVTGRPAATDLALEERSQLVHYHIRRGAPQEATTVVEQWLDDEPEGIAAWALAGDVWLELGREHDALEAYRRALLLHFARHAGSPEPPRGLLRRHRELLYRLEPPEDE